jgi:ParB-like chromosome segregation protein Spo0J
VSEVKQDYELVSVDAIEPHPRNPRRGDVEAIMASITANGWHGAITVQRSTSYVLAGNSRLRAAKALGMKAVPVIWRDVDDATAERLLVADNRATDLGYFDEETLGELLLSAEDLAGMLYSPADLELLGIALPDQPELPEGDGARDGPDVDGEGRGPAPVLGGVEREGGVVLVRETPAERQPEYVAAGVRSIVLPFALDDYLRVTDGLRAVRQARGYATNAEAIAALVAEAAEAL